MKTAIWNKVRSQLKKEFSAKGIEFCEMCGRRDYLSFAHRLKRRFITDEVELKMVALLCMSNPDGIGCHNELEHSSHEKMFEEITRIIENRSQSFG